MGTEFKLDLYGRSLERRYSNDQPGGHLIDALCYCLGEFKELSSVVANQRQRIKIVETGETIHMTAPDQVPYKRRPPKRRGPIGPPQKRHRQRDGVPVRDPRDRGRPGYVPADARQPTYIQVSEFTLRGAQAGNPREDDR